MITTEAGDMMGENDNQGVVFHTVQIEELVPADHPLRRIRKMVNTERIRELCAPLYCANNGRPSIPPEQLADLSDTKTQLAERLAKLEAELFRLADLT
ncbi:MAG: hypothetical protein B7Z73_03170 [Planctomycetia bacterium 21-64-5]|nr:MAG: hypothetical protein B7Z73_03170 [Planctomycetia bacterium 21-64-5]